ncbi:2-hydroxyacid dehydrogenase [Chloropicon primus]|nr:2-hydroxyacid dehydrogenase [Chloropicon primus]
MAGTTTTTAVAASASSLNTDKLNFDKSLSFESLKRVVGEWNFHEGTKTGDALSRIPEGTEVVVTKEMELPAGVVALLPSSVKLICEAGTGYNNIDCEAAKQSGITVCNVPEYSTDAVASMVMTFVLSLSCSLIQQQRKLWGRGSENREAWATLQGLRHFELAGKTMGLIGGRGAIGSKVGEMARVFGMKVLISSRSDRPCPGAEVVSLDDLLERSDFVSVHCPLNHETRSSLGTKAFERMKRSAYFINTARGGIVCEEELCEALDSGLIAGAGLDVQVDEPPAESSRLYDLAQKNLILTPHIGWQRRESRQRLLDSVARNIEGYFRGDPQNVVN